MTIEDHDKIPEDAEKEEELLILPPPQGVYLLPLTRRPFFPGMAAPVMIEQGPFYEVLKMVASSSSKYLGLVLTREEQVDIYKLKPKDVYKVGVLARILRIVPAGEGGAQVVLNMEQRFTAGRITKKEGLLFAPITPYREGSEKVDEQLKAYSINIITTIRELLKLNPLFKEELQVFLGHSDFTEPGKLADFAVALTTASREELQEVLETFNLQDRIDKALMLLRKELDLTKLQNTIHQKIEATISKSQKEYFLREQLRTIKKELGIEKEDKQVDIEKFEGRLEKREVPADVLDVIHEELDKLQTLEVMSAEYSVCRNYLDWLTIVPWGIFSEESRSLSQAQKVLEEDHYGLKDIKERILEFISVGKLTGGVKGSIIGLVGPPGVGKTSIGKSIARALNRQFYRFSVGGMRDEVEIKGHRRTYIGSMPGKLIQALKYCQTMNPVIMLDEVDKMGSSYQGDPASALLEVLDPEQNREFLDHYLDVRCDLSNVLFIVTANVLDTIPEPLKDRMEILRLSGYVLEEKVQIAKRYLIPRNRKAMGIKATQVSFSDKALEALINGYARESGVRSLENYIKKILRKVAMKLVKGLVAKKPSKSRPHKALINLDALEEYVGKPIFTSDRFYESTPVGVATGLAWTSLGGATLYIETNRTSADTTAMKLTGQVGNVMKESADIAWSYLHSHLRSYAPGRSFFKKSHVHVHIPEGATPKDGPSAGITMVCALLSLLLDQPVMPDLGMTGELTLTGRILGIGGLKEKLIAAKRSDLKVLIFPKENQRDYDELPAYLKEGITVHFVEHFDEVFHIAFEHE
ncbi:MAG: endopeptidase La [Verrucomicrobia bacterium]|nr:endopeptidase La [Verrucomicrobiota bacterium]